MKLTAENCPDVSDKRRAAINALSDEELHLEIDKGPASRFGRDAIPVLRLAQRLREMVREADARNEELDISRKANEIAERALAQAVEANNTAKESKWWAAGAVLIAAITAAVTWLTGH